MILLMPLFIASVPRDASASRSVLSWQASRGSSCFWTNPRRVWMHTVPGILFVSCEDSPIKAKPFFAQYTSHLLCSLRALIACSSSRTVGTLFTLGMSDQTRVLYESTLPAMVQFVPRTRISLNTCWRPLAQVWHRGLGTATGKTSG